MWIIYQKKRLRCYEMKLNTHEVPLYELLLEFHNSVLLGTTENRLNANSYNFVRLASIFFHTFDSKRKLRVYI